MLPRKNRVSIRLFTLLLLLIMAFSAALPTTLPARASQATQPQSVTIAGSFQSKAGCPADWKPECDKTFLQYDKEADVWHAKFDLPAGKYEYKAAINGSWTENYGAKAKSGGDNIPLELKEKATVNFYYDHKTHWVTDDHSAVIATVIGSFQNEIGCAADNKSDCLKSWLQDPDGDGIYTFTTTAIPAGSYDAKIAINEGTSETYGTDGAKDGAPISFTVAADKDEIYFEYNAAKHLLSVHPEGAPRGDLSLAHAIWVTKDTIAWKMGDYVKGTTFALHYDPMGAMTLTPKGIIGGQQIPLMYGFGGLNTKIVLQNPQLAGFASLKIGAADLDKIPEILKGQIAVTASSDKGKLIDATTVQLWGALDALYPYTGDLGVTYQGDAPTLRLWAPTAKSVALHLYTGAHSQDDQKLPMTFDSTTGVWSTAGDATWTNKFYLYEVEVYTRATGKVEQNLVTDPYSISLSMNSERSQIVNLDDAALMPPGWKDTKKPDLKAPEDIVIYELHVRDFSVNDLTVSEPNRGTFKAFTETNSNGMKHLKALAEAGLTHIHLLPVFDIATIEEDKSQWVKPDIAKLKSYPPDSEQQQAAVTAVQVKDGYNWGYDPFHYTTPEGSYSTNPDGSTRIIEFRQMVQALNAAGLRVVMDVVYNHTNASGQDSHSVLDKIVPGYYHRLNADGFVENSTCCANTATEHAMMEKLMVDSLHTWATAYKVDGFRFDLMGHHMVSNMVKVRQMLDGLTPAKDGVNGTQIYIYGEGWNFGEVADNARGKNATQLNLGGTGIGTFNDRLRDSVRGGSPFSDQREQGFITGLAVDSNANEQRKPAEQTSRLLAEQDLIRLGLAGNLTKYAFTDSTGKAVTGETLKYNGGPAGYTLDPQENIAYDSAHDNQTLFDAIQLKAPSSADIKARVRMNNLGVDVVMLSQGVPFFHAGDDMLRSKDMDNDSYDSGDWFNTLDFTYESNNWGTGLPIASKNKSNWEFMKPLLANPALRPSKDDILFAVSHFREMLKIRKSSALFRLQTAQDVIDKVKFFNVGPAQVPGLIVMNIAEPSGKEPFSQVLVFFNATPKALSFSDKALSAAYTLHPVQAASADPVLATAKFDAALSTFTIPARTTVVFVAAR